MILNPIVVDMDVGMNDPIPMSVDSDSVFPMDVGTSIQIVNVRLQNKEVTPSATAQIVVADSDFDGLSEVIVNSIPSNYGLIEWIDGHLRVS